MVNILIIHGTEGSPEVNWFPWLKKELEKLGHTVFVPKFPTPENQSLENWLDIFRDYEGYLDKNTIIIGHSLGPSFILNVLEKTDKKIKSAFLVAGFLGLLGNEHFDNLNKTFSNKKFDWEKIKSNCENFYVINSSDDPYVPLNKGEEIANNLGVDLIVLQNAGHINADSGYTKFEKMLDLIKNEIQSKT